MVKPSRMVGLWFFFFFVQLETPSDRSGAKLHGVCPTLGKVCSLELSALMTQGNAVRQTTCCWSWQYRPIPGLQSCGTVGLDLPS